MHYLLLFTGCNSKGDDDVPSLISGKVVELIPEVVEVPAAGVVGFGCWIFTVYTTVPTAVLPSTSIEAIKLSNLSRIIIYLINKDTQ